MDQGSTALRRSGTSLREGKEIGALLCEGEGVKRLDEIGRKAPLRLQLYFYW